MFAHMGVCVLIKLVPYNAELRRNPEGINDMLA